VRLAVRRKHDRHNPDMPADQGHVNRLILLCAIDVEAERIAVGSDSNATMGGLQKDALLTSHATGLVVAL